MTTTMTTTTTSSYKDFFEDQYQVGCQVSITLRPAERASSRLAGNCNAAGVAQSRRRPTPCMACSPQHKFLLVLCGMHAFL